MGQTIQDLRVAVRGLRRTTGFTITVLITLALGIGANAGIFSVVNGILLRPLPFRDAGRVVHFTHDEPYWQVSEGEFFDYRRDLGSLSTLAAYAMTEANLTGGDAPERITGVRVSDAFFDALGVAPALGRGFSPDEEKPGGPATVVIISHGLWQRYLGGERSIVGRTIQLDGVARTVVGVMPPRLDFPLPQTAVWLPLRLDADSLWGRNNHYLRMVGRLAPGATVAAATAEATVLASRWGRDYPDIYFADKRLVPLIEPIADRISGATRPYLLALLGAAGLVLLIACVNVANLLLVRGEARRTELGIRAALGASNTRVVKQLLAESALLTVGGTALGLALAWGGTRLLIAAAPPSVPRLDEIRIDLGVLAFIAAVAVITGLVFGLLPALRASRTGTAAVLRPAGRRAGDSGGRRVRSGLVVVEIALAVTILAGAGLLLRSLHTLQTADLGFDPDGIMTARVSLPPGYTNERAAAVVERIEEAGRAIPGVRAVTAMGWVPVSGEGSSWSIWFDGREITPVGRAPTATPQQVTADYFTTLGIRMIGGRDFDPTDRADAPLVTVINQTMARQLWPGVDPIGKTIRMYSSQDEWVTVVGVAADIRSSGIERDPPPTMYFHYPQAARAAYYIPRSMTIAVKVDGDPARMAGSMREIVAAAEPLAPVSEIRTMEAAIGTSFADRRFTTTLLGAFAILAVVLAGIGIYGVVAYGVSQRTYEIGLRMALGADRGTILRMIVLSESSRLLGIGLATGLLGALAVGRAIRSLLVGVGFADPATVAAVAATLTAVGFVAAFVPASRAARTSPTEALRGE